MTTYFKTIGFSTVGGLIDLALETSKRAKLELSICGHKIKVHGGKMFFEGESISKDEAIKRFYEEQDGFPKLYGDEFDYG